MKGVKPIESGDKESTTKEDIDGADDNESSTSNCTRPFKKTSNGQGRKSGCDERESEEMKATCSTNSSGETYGTEFTSFCRLKPGGTG